MKYNPQLTEDMIFIAAACVISALVFYGMIG